MDYQQALNPYPRRHHIEASYGDASDASGGSGESYGD